MDAARSHESRDGEPQGERDRRGPGRPRDPGIAPRVLEAASALFGELGYEGGSIAAISERSGVGKPSIYLRWKNRRELFIACVRALGPPPPAKPPAATLEEDLAAWSDAAAEALTGPDRRLVRAALFAGANDPDVAAALEATLLAPLRGQLAEVIRRWAARGGVRSGTNPGAVADLLLAPLMQAAVLGRAPEGHRTAAELVARSLAVDGAAA